VEIEEWRVTNGEIINPGGGKNAILPSFSVVSVCAVGMPMMKIRIVRMRVEHRFMPVPVRMRLGDRPVMLVLMMLVMGMAVIMFEGAVPVFMFMPFGKMHPQSKAHQGARNDQLDAQLVMQQDNCNERSNERR
jgi:hypothetical protein